MPVHAVCHVSQAARPLLVSAVCQEFSLSVRHGFLLVLLFLKLVLRPHLVLVAGYLVGTLLQDRLKQ